MNSLRTTLCLVVGIVAFSCVALCGETAESTKLGVKNVRAISLVDQQGDPLPEGALQRLGTLRFRPGSTVLQMTFSPDGKILASYSVDGKIRLWDFASGKELRSFSSVLASNSEAMSFSPNGKILSLSSNRSDFLHWEVATGKRIQPFVNVKIGINAFAYAPNGKTIAIFNNEGKLQVLDFESGKEIYKLEWKKDLEPAKPGLLRAFKAAIEALGGDEGADEEIAINTQEIRFSPDGKMVAVMGTDREGVGRLRFWNAATGKQLREFPVTNDGRFKMQFSPDSKRIAIIGNNALQIIDPGSGKTLSTTNTTHMFLAFAFSTDSKHLAVADHNGQARILKADSGKEVCKLEGPRTGMFALAFSPDGTSLVGACQHNMIHRWETTHWKKARSLTGHEGRLSFVAFASANQRLVTVGSDRVVCVWDPASGRELKHFALRETTEVDASIRSVSLSPDGKKLAVSLCRLDRAMDDAVEGCLRLMDLETNQTSLQFKIKNMSAGSLSFAPDGRSFVSAWDDGSVRIWDVSTGKEYCQLHNPRGDPEDDAAASMVGTPIAAFTPDGKFVVTRELDADEEGVLLNDGTDLQCSIRFWEIATGKERRHFAQRGQFLDNSRIGDGLNRLGISTDNSAGIFERVCSVRCSPDGKILALGDSQGLRLCDSFSGRELRRIGSRRLNSSSATFSPDGKLIAAGINEGALGLWEVATGTLLLEQKGHRGAINSLSFSPDGTTLASASDDTTALVWDVAALLATRKRQTVRGSPEKMASLWTTLRDNDAMKADRAIADFLDNPAETLPFLRQVLKPAAINLDAEGLDKLIADLDHNQFAVREKARSKLEMLEKAAEPALRKALSSRHYSVESRSSIERLLDLLQGPITNPDIVRRIRALEILQRIDTPEARTFVEKLADGAPAATLTREARKTLGHMNK